MAGQVEYKPPIKTSRSFHKLHNIFATNLMVSGIVLENITILSYIAMFTSNIVFKLYYCISVFLCI